MSTFIESLFLFLDLWSVFLLFLKILSSIFHLSTFFLRFSINRHFFYFYIYRQSLTTLIDIFSSIFIIYRQSFFDHYINLQSFFDHYIYRYSSMIFFSISPYIDILSFFYRHSSILQFIDILSSILQFFDILSSIFHYR